MGAVRSVLSWSSKKKKEKASSDMYLATCYWEQVKSFTRRHCAPMIPVKLRFLQVSSLAGSAHSPHEECTLSWVLTFNRHISSLPETVAQIVEGKLPPC